MEKIRPPELSPKQHPPILLCTSIADLIQAREEIIETVNYWYRNEAGLKAKITYSDYAHTLEPLNVIRRPSSKSTVALVNLPRMRHHPIDDNGIQLRRGEIAIRDGIGIMPVRVPESGNLLFLNSRRRTEGLPPITGDQLKSNWSGDLILGCVYPKSGDDFYVIADITNFQATSTSHQGEMVPGISLSPKAL